MELHSIVDQAKGVFGEQAEPVELLGWFAKRVGVDNIAVSVSLSGGVMFYFAEKALPGVDILFVDTGYHFAETLKFRDESAKKQNIITLSPRLSVREQNEKYGQDLYDSDPDKCCAMRKVAPLDAALRGYSVWVTGLRRSKDQEVPLIEFDEKREIIKVNPLSHYSKEDVDRLVKEYGIVENDLRKFGYTSIGCWPCTIPTEEGQDERAGRWSGKSKTECGLHI